MPSFSEKRTSLVGLSMSFCCGMLHSFPLCPKRNYCDFCYSIKISLGNCIVLQCHGCKKDIEKQFKTDHTTVICIYVEAPGRSVPHLCGIHEEMTMQCRREEEEVSLGPHVATEFICLES